MQRANLVSDCVHSAEMSPISSRPATRSCYPVKAERNRERERGRERKGQRKRRIEREKDREREWKGRDKGRGRGRERERGERERERIPTRAIVCVTVFYQCDFTVITTHNSRVPIAAKKISEFNEAVNSDVEGDEGAGDQLPIAVAKDPTLPSTSNSAAISSYPLHSSDSEQDLDSECSQTDPNYRPENDFLPPSARIHSVSFISPINRQENETALIPFQALITMRGKLLFWTMPLVSGFSRGSPVPPPFHSGAAPYPPQSPSSALKTSLLRAAQISVPPQPTPNHSTPQTGRGNPSANHSTPSRGRGKVEGEAGRADLIPTQRVEEDDTTKESRRENVWPNWHETKFAYERIPRSPLQTVITVSWQADYHCSTLASGATVAERLARSPPTKANRIQSPAGFSQVGIVPNDAVSRRVFWGSPVSPAPSFRRQSTFTSITLISSQDRAVLKLPVCFWRQSSCDSLHEVSVLPTRLELYRCRRKFRLFVGTKENFQNALHQHARMHQPAIAWTPECTDESLKIPDCIATHYNFGSGGCPHRPLEFHTQVPLNVPTNKSLVDSNQGPRALLNLQSCRKTLTCSGRLLGVLPFGPLHSFITSLPPAFRPLPAGGAAFRQNKTGNSTNELQDSAAAHMLLSPVLTVAAAGIELTSSAPGGTKQHLPPCYLCQRASSRTAAGVHTTRFLHAQVHSRVSLRAIPAPIHGIIFEIISREIVRKLLFEHSSAIIDCSRLHEYFVPSCMCRSPVPQSVGALPSCGEGSSGFES
ncbi:hypothetical protein PR048_026527 [Dryococelus australis]|uniref:Uncharacterized protein n=1 Tax=Dryococelus australis TaxID=614101 RepID=A0ABQ9GLJ7_9NEOP|nr:hypothetical protein PR048_026527 [Dryococelus australis]